MVRTTKRFRKLVAKPSFKGFVKFGADLVAVERAPLKVCMRQCIAAGVTVLDLSKKTMLEHYWRLKGQFGDRMTLLFSDTGESRGMERVTKANGCTL